MTWSDKKGLIAHLQVLRYDGSKFFKVLWLANESNYMHKIFTLFKPASYLQYHPEYKKPAAKFPDILDSF